MASALGHLDQQYKNSQSTKTRPEETKKEDDMKTEEEGTQTNAIYPAVIDFPTPTGEIATDQTGRFPTTSRRGSTYVFILYCYDSNAILAEPIKSRSQHEILRAHKKLHQELTTRGYMP